MIEVIYCKCDFKTRHISKNIQNREMRRKKQGKKSVDNIGPLVCSSLAY